MDHKDEAEQHSVALKDKPQEIAPTPGRRFEDALNKYQGIILKFALEHHFVQAKRDSCFTWPYLECSFCEDRKDNIKSRGEPYCGVKKVSPEVNGDMAILENLLCGLLSPRISNNDFRQQYIKQWPKYHNSLLKSIQDAVLLGEKIGTLKAKIAILKAEEDRKAAAKLEAANAKEREKEDDRQKLVRTIVAETQALVGAAAAQLTEAQMAAAERSQKAHATTHALVKGAAAAAESNATTLLKTVDVFNEANASRHDILLENILGHSAPASAAGAAAAHRDDEAHFRRMAAEALAKKAESEAKKAALEAEEAVKARAAAEATAKKKADEDAAKLLDAAQARAKAARSLAAIVAAEEAARVRVAAEAAAKAEADRKAEEEAKAAEVKAAKLRADAVVAAQAQQSGSVTNYSCCNGCCDNCDCNKWFDNCKPNCTFGGCNLM